MPTFETTRPTRAFGLRGTKLPKTPDYAPWPSCASTGVFIILGLIISNFKPIFSFWGKFGQRCTLPKTQYFTDPVKFYNLVFDGSVKIHSVNIVDTNMVAVTYEMVSLIDSHNYHN